MAYEPGLQNGTSADLVSLPPGATGGMGVLTALYQELKKENRLLTEVVQLLTALVDRSKGD